MGRRTLLTPQVQQKICDALAAGNYFEVACQYAGIDISTAMMWLQRGRGTHPSRPQEDIYVAFVEAVEKAQADDEIETIATLKQLGKGGQVVSEEIHTEPDQITTFPDGRVVEIKGESTIKRTYTRPEWTAHAWRMERKHFQRWGRKERLDVNVKIQAMAEAIAKEHGMTVDEVLREAEGLLSAHEDAD